MESQPIIDASDGMFQLAKKIYENAPQYDWIISDEASGRLVSLFLKKIFDYQKQKLNLPRTEISFVAGGRITAARMQEIIEQNVKDFLGKTLQKIKPRKALLVTEYIRSGKGMEMLVTILKELGVNFDIATVSIESPGLEKMTQMIGDKGQTYFGDKLSTGTELHNQTWLSGVERDQRSSSPFPQKTKDPREDQATQNRIQENINQARNDVSKLAENSLKILEGRT